MEKRRQEKKRLNPFNAKKAFKKLLFIQTNYGLSEFDSNHWRSYACVKNPCLKLNAGVFIKSHSVKKLVYLLVGIMPLQPTRSPQ